MPRWFKKNLPRGTPGRYVILHLGDLYTESGQTLLHSVLQLWFYWHLRIFLNNMSKCLYKYCQMFAKFHRNVAQFTEPRFPKFQGNSSGILCMKSEEKQVEKQVILPEFAGICRNSKSRRIRDASGTHPEVSGRIRSPGRIRNRYRSPHFAIRPSFS